MSLKPLKCDCFFIYECPTCGAQHQQSYEDITKIGKLLCYCGKVLKLAKMLGVKVIPKYEDKQPQQPKQQNKQRDKDVVKGLVKLGIYKAQAQAVVDKINSSGIIYESEGEFFQACIRKAFEKC